MAINFLIASSLVSKRVSKLAVVRNRVKRRLKAAVKKGFEHAKPGFDYVIIGKLEAKQRDMKLLVGDLKYALKKIHAEAN